MDDSLQTLFIAGGGLLIGALIGYALRRFLVDSRLKSVEARAEEIIAQAEATRKTIDVQAP
ncbi:MAG: hypothetical protein ACE5G8_07075, partial [Anaerolineae bacterium]